MSNITQTKTIGTDLSLQRQITKIIKHRIRKKANVASCKELSKAQKGDAEAIDEDKVVIYLISSNAKRRYGSSLIDGRF